MCCSRCSVFAGLTMVVVAVAPHVVHAQKDDASCKVVFDAGIKAITTPNHAYITMKMGPGASTTSESISTGRVRYLQLNGKWTRSPITLEEELTQSRANLRNAKAYSCRTLRVESVNGVAATVYSVHEVTEAGTSDSQVWIANGTGLPLRQDTQLGVGGTTVSTRIEYANVQAPAGVQ